MNLHHNGVLPLFSSHKGRPVVRDEYVKWQNFTKRKGEPSNVYVSTLWAFDSSNGDYAGRRISDCLGRGRAAVACGTSEHRPIYEVLFRRFEESNPGIKVEILSASRGSVDERLTVLYAGDQMPDIWGEGGRRQPSRVRLGADLAPFVERDRMSWILTISPAAWANVYRDSQIIGMPWGCRPRCLNRARLMKRALYPPVSWTDASWNYDVLQYARQLTGALRTGVEVFDLKRGFGKITCSRGRIFRRRLSMGPAMRRNCEPGHDQQA